jgi:hypothetical protein
MWWAAFPSRRRCVASSKSPGVTIAGTGATSRSRGRRNRGDRFSAGFQGLAYCGCPQPVGDPVTLRGRSCRLPGTAESWLGQPLWAAVTRLKAGSRATGLANMPAALLGRASSAAMRDDPATLRLRVLSRSPTGLPRPVDAASQPLKLVPTNSPPRMQEV